MVRNFFKFSFVFLFVSCAVGPDFEPPKTEVSKEWQGNNNSDDKLVSRGGEIDLKWWNSFNDPLLVELIEQAASENLDIKKALLHIKESRNIKELVVSDLFPAVNITANYKRDRQSENNDFSFDNSFSGRDFYETGFDATWELDIFGKIRRDVEASKAELEGSADAARNVYLMTFAEVAKNYLELRTLQKEKNIIQGNIDLQQKSFELIEHLLIATFSVTLLIAIVMGIRAAVVV